MKYLLQALLAMLCVTTMASAKGSAPFTGHYKPTDYQEDYRPQFHFSPQNEWMNDINALWYLDGTWHMTYQWGKAIRHGGYATSPDLLHWNDHGVALIPQHSHIQGAGAVPNVSGQQVYSGSGVVVSGKAAEKITGSTNDTLVTLYTGVAAGTCIAWSNDEGKTWHNYEGNPVANPTDGQDPRDPCVFWYEPDHIWIMALYENGTTFYRSDDLISWEKSGNIEFGFECPDVFQLPVNGNEDEKKWVLADASGKYLVGEFNGETFVPEQEARLMDHGPDFYAAQTFFPQNVPEGKLIQIAWMDAWNGGVGERGWQRNATFPVELSLVRDGDNILLTRNPISAIQDLYQDSLVEKDVELVSPAAGDEVALLGDKESKTFDLSVTVDLKQTTARELLFQLNNRTLRVDLETLALNGKEHPLFNRNSSTDRAFEIPQTDDGLLNIRILVDWSCLEVFAQDGRFSYSEQYRFLPSDQRLEVRAVDGKAKVVSLEWHSLKSIWNR